jgi:proteic killer suppression protein
MFCWVIFHYFFLSRFPDIQLHELKGKRKGVYSVTVSGNWRITFKFDGDSVIEVDLEDYH